MNSSVRNFILWFMIVALVVMIWVVFRRPAASPISRPSPTWFRK